MALVDWWAVGGGRRAIEIATKPSVVALLLVAALALAPASEAQRGAFVGALLLSLAGDVALLPPARWFTVGLGAFLLAHGAYVVGLLAPGAGGSPLIGLVLTVAGAVVIGVPIVRAARRRGPTIGWSLAVYLFAISATVVAATTSGDSLAVTGAIALYASDGILGWNRFVRPLPRGRLLTRIPYHLGQALMVVSLVA